VNIKSLSISLLLIFLMSGIIDLAEANDKCIENYLKAKGLIDLEHYTEALSLAKEAATRKCQDAQYLLGEIYALGLGVPKNDSLAFQWYLKAAKKKHIEALYCVGIMYDKGRGVKSSLKEAKKWYLKAAKKGHAKAQLRLGDILHLLSFGSKDKDRAKAREWYRKAAEQSLAEAQFKLGKMYHCFSISKDCDKVEAAKWFRLSAAQGYGDAQYYMGKICVNGWGVDEDDNEAFKWYQKSAEQGNPDAQYELGYMYEQGKGVSKDYTEALKWYSKAMDQGNLDAKDKLCLPESRRRLALIDKYIIGETTEEDFVSEFVNEKWWGINAASHSVLGIVGYSFSNQESYYEIGIEQTQSSAVSKYLFSNNNIKEDHATVNEDFWTFANEKRGKEDVTNRRSNLSIVKFKISFDRNGILRRIDRK